MMVIHNWLNLSPFSATLSINYYRSNSYKYSNDSVAFYRLKTAE